MDPSDHEPTLGLSPSTRFLRHIPGFRWVGVLTPIKGLVKKPIRMTETSLTLGREQKLSAYLQDPSVSRPHVRVTRMGDEFFLEDLGSLNGTHVDGAPIVSCVLHDGDTIQIGQTVFCFERFLEPDLPTGTKS
jgi:pSer/pThr/pTyr-binding forkhead associated (FHA) protein